MKRYFIFVTLAATALLLSASPSFGADGKPANSKAAGDSKKEIEAERKALALINHPVDINSASPAELKKLPGIGDAEAQKIIAGRPYGSSAWLSTKKILPDGFYLSIRDFIVARQPFKDGDKNAEIYRKLSDKEAAEKKAVGQKAGDKKQ